jgi:hypothetical protein
LTQLAEVLTKDEVQFTVKIVRKEPDQYYFVEFMLSPDQKLRRRIDSLVEKNRSLSTLFALPTINYDDLSDPTLHEDVLADYEDGRKRSVSRFIRSFVQPEEELRWFQTATFAAQHSAVFHDIIASLKMLHETRCTIFPLLSTLKTKDAATGLFLLGLIQVNNDAYYPGLRQVLVTFNSKLHWWTKYIFESIDQIGGLCAHNVDGQSPSAIDSFRRLKLAFQYFQIEPHLKIDSYWLKRQHQISDNQFKQLKSSVQILVESPPFAAALSIFHFLKSEEEALASKIHFQSNWIEREFHQLSSQITHSTELTSALEYLIDHVVKIYGSMGQCLLQKEAIDCAEMKELSLLEYFSDATQELFGSGAIYNEGLKLRLNARISEFSQMKLVPSYCELLPPSPSNVAFVFDYSPSWYKHRYDQFNKWTALVLANQQRFDHDKEIGCLSREASFIEIWWKNYQLLYQIPHAMRQSIFDSYKWECIGDVGRVPPLPPVIVEFLNTRIWYSLRRYVTYDYFWNPLIECGSDYWCSYLVLISQTVNGERYSLDLLDRLTQNSAASSLFKLKGNWRQYDLGNGVKKSYWALMMISRSSKSFTEQQSWLANQRSIGGARAGMATMLEIATVRQFATGGANQFGDTRCQVGLDSNVVVGWKDVDIYARGSYAREIEFLSPTEASSAKLEAATCVWRFLDD